MTNEDGHEKLLTIVRPRAFEPDDLSKRRPHPTQVDRTPVVWPWWRKKRHYQFPTRRGWPMARICFLTSGFQGCVVLVKQDKANGRDAVVLVWIC